MTTPKAPADDARTDDALLALAEGRVPPDALDARTAREAEGLDTLVSALRGLPTPEAPPELLSEVERRVRRARRLRMTEPQGQRLAWEAIVNLLLLLGLLAIYFVGVPDLDTRTLRPIPGATSAPPESSQPAPTTPGK
jgi:hypothetical protein